MRSHRATHNLIAVSANAAETAINTEQTLDTSMLVDMGDIIQRQPRREDNASELNGKEEADAIYDLGHTVQANFTFNKAQPQHFAFILAYALGDVATAAAGDGYLHTITPALDDLDAARSNPSFTAAQRFGLTVLKQRFASLFMDSFTATFAKDDWLKIVGQALGTGKITKNVVEETISAAETVTQLTLAANAVEGSTAQARLDNVQRIRVELAAGVWTEVAYTAVSAATPAVITIVAPGEAATVRSYKVLYVAAESGWMTFPARVSETPMRISQLNCVLGGSWTGSAFAGGRTLNADIRTITWNFLNNGAVEFIPGADGAYAARYFRDSRTQTIALDREFKDYILQNHIDANDTFGLHLVATGAVFDDPHAYKLELIFPKLGVVTAPISVDGKRLAEAGDLRVMEDDTYGSVIARITNLQATYAA
jgi:hypothetical protein